MSFPAPIQHKTDAELRPRVDVSVVVPTLDEVENLAPLCARLSDALHAAGVEDFEIIFVDDESRDGTADEARSLKGVFGERVRLLERHGTRSLSGAVIDGWGIARGELLAVIDADLQHPPEVIPKLLGAIHDGADLVVASRYAPGGDSALGALRDFFSRTCTRMVRLSLGSDFRVSDPLSGCFALRRSVIAGSKLSASGFKILMEVLACGDYGTVREIPFRFGLRQHGDSKLGLRTALRDLRGLARAAREFKRRKRNRVAATALASSSSVR